MATAAVLVVLLDFFEPAAFRWAALAGLFAGAGLWVVTRELVRFRFESFAAALFNLARIVLLVLRATRLFAAGLLLPTRFRALDEVAALAARFGFGFTLDAAPVFFVFELVVFFGLLRAAIVNLSTRKLSTHTPQVRARHCSKSVHEYCSSKRQVDFLSTKSPASLSRTPATSALDD